MLFELLYRAKLHTFAPANLVQAFFHRVAQPLEFRPFLLLSVFQQPEAVAYHLTGVAVSPGRDLGFDEPVKAVCEIDISGGHHILKAMLTRLAKIASCGKRQR